MEIPYWAFHKIWNWSFWRLKFLRKISMKKANDYNLTDPKIMEDPYEFYTAIHNDDARAVHVEGVG